MSGVRSMLARVKRLEAVRAPALSPFEAAYGSLGAWEAECQAGIAAGYLDSRDVPAVVLAVAQWHRNGYLTAGASKPSRDPKRYP